MEIINSGTIRVGLNVVKEFNAFIKKPEAEDAACQKRQDEHVIHGVSILWWLNS